MADQQQQSTSSGKHLGQVTLTQMLVALDKNISTDVGKKLKKLTKKKQLKAPDDLQQAKVERQIAYSEVSKDVTKWDPIVKRNRKANLSFPLDRQQDVLAPSAEASFKPRNEFEEAIQNERTMIHGLVEEQELTAKERKYLKAISAEEAKERLQEMQKTRVLLGSFGAKMKQRKKIKSKSYRKLLKQERLKKHMKTVESSDDKLLNEIERLKRLRAQERASLRHKNTGKWAKHSKFRAKYDEDARNKLVEQIQVASKFLNRPASSESESESESVSEPDGSESSDDDENDEVRNQSLHLLPTILSAEGEDELNDEEDEQRKLMSEAFANDDVIDDFKKLKSKIANEEQPVDVNLFLPGWGDWAGPGIKINKRKKQRYIIKADKIDRKDKSLDNVIISEKANDEMKEFQVKKIPRGIKNEKHFEKIMKKPVVATFIDQTSHRNATKQRIETKLGTRIEPISERAFKMSSKAKWA